MVASYEPVSHVIRRVCALGVSGRAMMVIEHRDGYLPLAVTFLRPTGERAAMCSCVSFRMSMKHTHARIYPALGTRQSRGAARVAGT